MSDDHDETGRTAVGGPSRRQLRALDAAAGALAWAGRRSAECRPRGPSRGLHPG